MTTNSIEKLMSEILESISKTEELIGILYKSRMIANYYNDIEMLDWIENELIGYNEESELPKYRENVPSQLYEFQSAMDYYSGTLKREEKVIAVRNVPFRNDIQTIIGSQDKNLYMTLNYRSEYGKIKTGKWKFDSGAMRSIVNSIKLKISDYIHKKNFSIANDRETILLDIFNRFHISTISLKFRRTSKTPYEISDEYDVQDILKAFLKLHFEVLGKEEITKKFGNKNPRIDFLLINENIGIEVKYVNKNNKTKIIDQILADKELYSVDDRILELYFFIYDPDYLIDNRKKFIKDLEEFKNPAINKLKIIIKPNEE